MTLNNTEEEFFKYFSNSDIKNFKYFSGDWDNETDCKELIIRYTDDGGNDDETESEESELE